MSIHDSNSSLPSIVLGVLRTTAFHTAKESQKSMWTGCRRLATRQVAGTRATWQQVYCFFVRQCIRAKPGKMRHFVWLDKLQKHWTVFCAYSTMLKLGCPKMKDLRLHSWDCGFLRRYSCLAKLAYSQGQKLWLVMPKAHCFHHICLELLEQSKVGVCINPLCFSVQQDEDFIGRGARLSRHVSSVHCSERTVDRYLMASYFKSLKVVTW